MGLIPTVIKNFFTWLLATEVEAASNLLNVSEYDSSYFDGRLQATRHNAGYGKYERWFRNDSEFWKDKASNWVNHLALSGKKLLEIGCAKGFLVKDLRDLGVDAWGIDVSPYAIGECEPEVAPYVSVADARNLGSLGYSRNEFDVLVTSRFMECMSDAEINQFITDSQFISRKCVHLITPPDRLNETYYNSRTLAQWEADFNWKKGTVLAPYNDEDNFITV